MSADDDVVLGEDGRRLRPVKALLRALDVLEALRASPQPLSLNQLVAATGMSRTAAYNVAATYEIRGLVRRDAQNRYALGWGLLELGEQVRSRSALGDAARPIVEDLAETTGETVLLGVMDHGSVIYVEKAESRRSVRMVEAPGRRVPLHHAATGLVLLAHASVPARQRYLASLAAREVIGGRDLADVLENIRRAGHAVSVQDLDPDLASASAPVGDPGGEVVAALTVAGPASRLTRDRVDEFVPQLLEAAAGIATTIAGRRHP